eukprot:scaffold118296_cov17-Tisochrysis_lutea.AAC.2
MSGLWAGRTVGPATRPAHAPKRQVDNLQVDSASTQVQAPPEPERMLLSFCPAVSPWPYRHMTFGLAAVNQHSSI